MDSFQEWLESFLLLGNSLVPLIAIRVNRVICLRLITDRSPHTETTGRYLMRAAANGSPEKAERLFQLKLSFL